MRKYETKREKGAIDMAGRVVEGGRAGQLMQTRFKQIPKSHLNAETVAGVRDMTLGRVKDGKPSGAPTIRFDTGRTSGAKPHINIDPKGRPNAANPHIEVPAGLVKSASVVNKTLRYSGITLTAAAVAIDAWRIGTAFADDMYVRNNAAIIIEELEESIYTLKSTYKTETDSRRRKEIKMTIEHLEIVLRDVKRCRTVPVQTVRTASAVGGGWAMGLAGGRLGAWGGMYAGTAIGSAFGPAGAAVGAPVGAVVGGIGGGIAAGIGGSYAGEAIAEEALKLAD